MSFGRTGTGDDEIYALEMFRAMVAVKNRYAAGGEPRGEIGGHIFGRLLEKAHIGTHGMEQLDGGTATAACTYDSDMARGEIDGGHGCLSEV